MELLEKTRKAVKPINEEWVAAAQKRLDNLTKPPGSLGRLEEFARRLVAIAEDVKPKIDKKVIFTFAGDHGIVDEGVSAYPKEVTPQMVFNFLRGGAGINVLARHAGADVVVIDIGVDFDFTDASAQDAVSGARDANGQNSVPLRIMKVMRGTRNFSKGPAMTKSEAIKCIESGIELVESYAKQGYKIIGTGDMGIGNTTPSSAIAAVLTGKPVSEVTGRGTGISDEGLAKKVRVIEEAILLNKPDPKDALDVLSKVGGTEIGGIAGLILGSAAKRIPVIVDGFISTAGALIAYNIEPSVKDYMFAAHKSVEKGHRSMLDAMGLTPIVDLGLRLGEGTGAALAMVMIEAGLKIYNEMATFQEAGVSGEISN